MSAPRYAPPWFLRNPHAQTIWGKFVRPGAPLPPMVRERWATPDGDHVTVVRVRPDAPRAPRLLLLHGLEGTERSHYVEALFRAAWRRGWGADLLLFRGCDGALNAQPRFYHSGETGDVAHVAARLADRHPGAPLLACGVSLGGNVLVKWLGEGTRPVPDALRAAVAVSVPYDLARGSRHIGRGFARIYETTFLRTLRSKALAKRERFPAHFAPAARISAIRTLWEFDDVVTAPLHGFDGAADYYARSSGKRFVAGIRVPSLLLSAVDDPFLPCDVLDEVRAEAAATPQVTLEFEPHGGHVGFVTGAAPWRTDTWLAERVPAFLASHLDDAAHADARAVLVREGIAAPAPAHDARRPASVG